MASNYTENFGLCQWEATDQVLRTDFNEVNQKIDRALEEDAVAITALTSQLAQKGNCRIEMRSYVGNGQYGQSTPTRITFSSMPTAILITGHKAICLARGGDKTGTIALSTDFGSGVSSLNFIWSGGTVSYYSSSNATAQLNYKDQAYWAIAFFMVDGVE